MRLLLRLLLRPRALLNVKNLEFIKNNNRNSFSYFPNVETMNSLFTKIVSLSRSLSLLFLNKVAAFNAKKEDLTPNEIFLDVADSNFN